MFGDTGLVVLKGEEPSPSLESDRTSNSGDLKKNEMIFIEMIINLEYRKFVGSILLLTNHDC